MSKRGSNNLLIIAVIAVVNALGYGIIIPILYSYSKKFGLSDFQNGLLFSIFSLCQFVATPIIGRLSDKYGRRPMLLVSLAGTVVSFMMMALARNGIWLFVARALDGITAGNISVASAVISDTTKPEERAKGFGIIGAAFGFGFVFGPAISAVFVKSSMSMPFWVAAGVTVVAFLMTLFLLPETNKLLGQVKKGDLFEFGKMFGALKDEGMGKTLMISGLYSLAFSLFIYAYQPYAVKVLHMDPQMISVNFIGIGLMGVIAQVVLIPLILKRFGEKRVMEYATLAVAVSFMTLGLIRTSILFIVVTLIQALVNSFIGPLVQTVLSREADQESQGSILGISASIASIGMIVGPIIGGALAGINLSVPFFAASTVMLSCVVLSVMVRRHRYHKGLETF